MISVYIKFCENKITTHKQKILSTATFKIEQRVYKNNTISICSGMNSVCFVSIKMP